MTDNRDIAKLQEAADESSSVWLEQRRVEGHIDPARWIYVAFGGREVLEVEAKHLLECDQCRHTIEKIRKCIFPVVQG